MLLNSNNHNIKMQSKLLIALILAAVLGVARPLTDAVEIPEKIVDPLCLHKVYKYAFPRAYISTGMVDPNYKGNVEKLTANGFTWWPYIVPCFKCGHAEKQVIAVLAVKEIATHMVSVYLDASNGWSKSQDKNREFISALIRTIVEQTHVPVIVTNKYSFEKIAGKDWSDLSELPLYYIAPDGKENCQDFAKFGGWTKPAAKLFRSSASVCGNKVDLILPCNSGAAPEQAVMADSE